MAGSGRSIIHYGKRAAQAVIFAVLNHIMGLAPLKEDEVLFASDVRGEMGGNFCFVEAAMPDELTPRYDFVPDRRNRRSLGQALKLFYRMSTCKYILLEDYFRYTSYMRVRKGQQICQLWHGAGAYKKFGYSRAGGSEGIKIHKGYRKYAKAIVSAEPIRENYAEAFGLSLEKVQATGIPRTDIFFDEEYKAKVREELFEAYPILREKKVILFAPTYRGLRSEDASYDFAAIDPQQFYEALHDDYVFVFKWHPANYNNFRRGEREAYQTEEYGDFFLDLSKSRDINDLLLVTDVLVTDYSSVIFDYLLCDKPIVYYTYDLEDYRDGRGMYYEFETYVYGAVAQTQEELMDAIRQEDLMMGKREAFRQQFMAACDGHASQRTCDWIFGDTLPKGGGVQ